MSKVVNTAQFRFPPGSPRPSWEEIATFIKQLDTDPMLMETVYKTASDRSLFVKFTSLEGLRESLKKNLEPRRFAYANGESVLVRMCIAGTNVHYVRVFDLPPELGDDNLVQVLAAYGEVERVVREKFPADLGLDHLYTGVRGVYIDVRKEIPPAITFLNMKARIFYSGLKDTCFLCQAVGHRRDTCPQRVNRNKQEKRQQQVPSLSSYAEVVSGKEVEKETVDDIIEIVEEEYVEEEDEAVVAEKTMDSGGEELAEGAISKSAAELDKEIRRKKGMEELEKVAKVIQEAIANPQAFQRRAQYAASRSSSGSGSAPKKKCARKTNY